MPELIPEWGIGQKLSDDWIHSPDHVLGISISKI
jgi:hypothetical protein